MTSSRYATHHTHVGDPLAALDFGLHLGERVIVGRDVRHYRLLVGLIDVDVCKQWVRRCQRETASAANVSQRADTGATRLSRVARPEGTGRWAENVEQVNCIRRPAAVRNGTGRCAAVLKHFTVS